MSTSWRKRLAPWWRPWPLRILCASVLVAGIAGAALGYFLRLDLPDIRGLEDYNPPVMSQVLAADGSLLESFAEQRRILVEFRDIPPAFLDALLAAEDTDFYRHTGIDFKGILRAAWRDLRARRLAQGASTLTQQLARNLFLHADKTLSRKLREAALALQIERYYSKQEILAFYCNQIYMGHGRYGIEAASRFYFGKRARDLDLASAAMLAGLIQRPEGLTPVRHPDRAKRRRDYVIGRMVETGKLSPEAAEEAKGQEIRLASRDHGDIAPYFVEEVRRWLQERRGSGLYKDGLRIHTTLDPTLQRVANEAVGSGLNRLDRRQGYRGAYARVPAGDDPTTYEPESWEGDPAPGDRVAAVVSGVTPERATVRLPGAIGALDAEAVAWTKEEDLGALLRVGDIVHVRVLELPADGPPRLELDQIPRAEAALIAVEPETGAVRALVGGYDYERSEFDRAMQARRQTGSAFKPFVYIAALDAGWTLADTLLDEPTVFLDPRQPEPYQPENYSNRYYETLTLRRSLEKSANIATVKLLDEIGYAAVIDVARRLGISGSLQPYASLALGSFEATLLELTSAYGTFANQGVRVEPHLVDSVFDRFDNLVEKIEPGIREAVRPETAYVINRLLGGVISDGTGRAAADLDGTLAGKTGTTDDNTDAWFIGYAPRLAVGVWVGFDEPKSLGKLETGARAALPIWRAFMEEALTTLPDEDFFRPGRVREVRIDRQTGLVANRHAYCRDVVTEVFVAGTEPARFCSVFHHQQLRLPYPFQRYSLGEDGAIEIPADHLDALLEQERSVRIADGGRRLEAVHSVGERLETVRLPLRVLPPSPPAEPPASRVLPFDMTGWVGKDGRPATVHWLDAAHR